MLILDSGIWPARLVSENYRRRCRHLYRHSRYRHGHRHDCLRGYLYHQDAVELRPFWREGVALRAVLT